MPDPLFTVINIAEDTALYAGTMKTPTRIQGAQLADAPAWEPMY